VVNLQIITTHMKFREFQNIGHAFNKKSKKTVAKQERLEKHQPLVGPMKKNCHHNRPFDAKEKGKIRQAPPPMNDSHYFDSHYKNRWLIQLQILANIIRNPHKSSHCAVTRSKIRPST
jgi:hypothetical protein